MKIIIKNKIIKFFILSIFFLPETFFAQSPEQVQMFRNEEKGNIQYRKKGTLDGNLVRTIYQNTGEVSDWFDGAVSAPHGEWPKGTGHRSLDGLALLIGAKIKITDALGRKVDITPVLSSYREEMDKDPVTAEVWGLEPVPGYVNPQATRPGINIDKTTFPKKWPRSIFYDLYGNNETEIEKWDGYWYGYFGRGISNAQLETYFVADDSKDKEFARVPYNFYPLKNDSSHGGLGMRVEVRGFQWTHVLAEDIIFWHYDIVNLSDNDYDSTVFGFYTDPSVGSVSNDARFDSYLDLAYSWAPSGKGLPDNYKTGYYGQAFLESPGNSKNNIDDDSDGMIDETRSDGIDNDKDWQKYTDGNKNGKWEEEEPLNDDLGKDGVGPYDPQYKGADEGQGDGLPTLGEPNFDKTDKDESDQIGLQSAYIGLLSDKGHTGVWPKNDQVMWNAMTSGFRDTTIKNANISMVFSSGIFPLKKNMRERFSIAIVFGDNLEDLIFNKVTVQAIYNANYNFAQPPLTPTLKAVAGNKKVYLYWDDFAEKSYDRFLRKFDFEGYLLYRSSEPEFQDIKTITDSKGQQKFWKPIKQWDLINGVKGPDPVGINGAHFWRGDDSGLDHSFVDTTVLNGVKYYYALVSYDRGVVPTTLDSIYGPVGGLTPSECTKIITEDFTGTVKFIDQNCAVIIPNAPVAGYVGPEIEGNLTSLKSGIGSGSMSLQIVNPNLVLEGYRYNVKFDSTGKMPNYKTKSFDLLRYAPQSNVADTIAKNSKVNIASSVYDGISISIQNDSTVIIDETKTGWMPGFKTNASLTAAIDKSFFALNVAWPSDYEIRFSKNKIDESAFADGPYIKDSTYFTIINTSLGYKCKFLIQDMDNDGKYNVGDTIRILDGFKSNEDFKICYNFGYNFRLWTEDPRHPTDGDKFLIKTKKPFAGGDIFEFNTRSSHIDNNVGKKQLDKISVVPNPYIAAASWERRTLFQSDRGARKIDFVNLPSECTIKIFTITGALVKVIEKKSAVNDGSISWDLISDDGMEVAYGLYLYHVDAPNIGSHIGKFAIVK